MIAWHNYVHLFGNVMKDTLNDQGFFNLILSFQHKLAHHRWLISFSFGHNNLATHEYKKLKALLKDSNIQVLDFFFSS